MMKLASARGAKNRGVALITVIGLLLVLLVFAGGLVTQLAMEVNSVKQHGVSNVALSAADAGIHGMVAAIQEAAINNVAPPAGPLVYNYPEAVGPSTVSYSVQLDQTWPVNGLVYYRITSIGSVDNGIEKQKRIVSAIVRSQPYARYASFSIYEVNKYGNPVWYRYDQTFDGPVYSGGPMRIDYQDGVKLPIFQQGVTTLNTPVWAPSAPGNPTDWAAVSNGSQNFTIDSTALALPQPSSDIVVASEAWEGDGNNTFSSGFPSVPPGVYINGKNAATGGGTIMSGIFVNVNGTAPGNNVLIDSSVVGNTETMTFSSPVKGFGAPYTVTINFTGPDTGTTTVTQGTNSKTYAGVPSGEPGPSNPNTGNGAIFVDGNIVFGNKNPDVTLRGELTFATPDYSKNTGSIYIDGNVKYADSTRDKTALWADDIYMNTTASNLEVDASIIAGFPGEVWSDGNFSNIHCNKFNCGSKDQGTLTILGGLIENDRGAVGEWVGPTHTGFTRVINYDSRLAADPPPFNPTTGAFNLIAWDDLGTP